MKTPRARVTVLTSRRLANTAMTFNLADKGTKMKQMIAALALLALTGAASATPKPPPVVQPPPVVTPAPNVTTDADADADADAAAKAGAVAGAGAKAVTGPVTATGTGGASKAKAGDVTNEIGGDTINSRARSLSLGIVLPQSAPTLAPMAKIECPTARITQDASTGWAYGLTPGTASAKTDPIGCERVTLINAKIDTCQDGDAQRMMDLYAAEVFKGYEAKSYAARFNLDPEACALRKELWELKRRPMPPPAPVHNWIVTLPPPVAAVPPPVARVEPCPKGWTRNSKGVCYKPTPPQICKTSTGANCKLLTI